MLPPILNPLHYDSSLLTRVIETKDANKGSAEIDLPRDGPGFVLAAVFVVLDPWNHPNFVRYPSIATDNGKKRR